MMVSTTVWLTIEPQWSRFSPPSAVGMTVTGVLKKRPKTIRGVAIELELNIPNEAFLPLRPKVTIDVPEEALHYEPQVTVEFPAP